MWMCECVHDGARLARTHINRAAKFVGINLFAQIILRHSRIKEINPLLIFKAKISTVFKNPTDAFLLKYFPNSFKNSLTQFTKACNKPSGGKSGTRQKCSSTFRRHLTLTSFIWVLRLLKIPFNNIFSATLSIQSRFCVDYRLCLFPFLLMGNYVVW